MFVFNTFSQVKEDLFNNFQKQHALDPAMILTNDLNILVSIFLNL